MGAVRAVGLGEFLGGGHVAVAAGFRETRAPPVKIPKTKPGMGSIPDCAGRDSILDGDFAVVAQVELGEKLGGGRSGRAAVGLDQPAEINPLDGDDARSWPGDMAELPAVLPLIL